MKIKQVVGIVGNAVAVVMFVVAAVLCFMISSIQSTMVENAAWYMTGCAAVALAVYRFSVAGLEGDR